MFDEDYNRIDYEVNYVNYSRCNETTTKFKNIASTNADYDEYLCVYSDGDLYLKGLWGDSLYNTQFSIEFLYWDQTNDASCQDIDTIKDLVEGATYYVKLISSYFESEDFSNPIKQYVDSTIYDYVNIGYSKEKDIYLSYNDARTQNSYLSPFGGYTFYEYLSVDSISTYFTVSDTSSYLAVFRFYLTNKKESILRSSLGLLDIFGIAGGLSSLIAMIVGLFINSYAEKLYNYTIASDLYQVDSSLKPKKQVAGINTDEQIEFNKGSPHTVNRSIYPLNSRHESDQASHFNDISLTKPAIDKSNYGTQTSETAKIMRFDLLKNSFDSMKSRRRYNYTALDFCYNLCVCFKCKMKKKGDQLTAYDRYQMYKQSADKLNLEFDAVEFTKSQRKLKMLAESLLDKRERSLINFQYI